MIRFRLLIEHRIFYFCLFLLFALSSCSTTSFLHRKYSPGSYVEHPGKVPAAEVYANKKDNRPVAVPLAAKQEKALVFLKKASPERTLPEAYAGQVSKRVEKPADQNEVEADSKQRSFSAVQPGPERKSIRPSLRTVCRRAMDDDNLFPEKHGRMAFNYGLAAFISILVLLASLMLISASAPVAVTALLLEGSILFLLGFFCYCVFLLLAIIFSVWSISEAKKQKVPVPQKAVNGLILALLPILFVFLFGLMHRTF